MADQPATRQSFHGRSFVSFVTLLSFLVMTFSGVVLYLGPSGGKARATAWAFWSLGRDGWMTQHITSCAVFVVAGLVHVYYNRKALWSYLHSKASRGIRRRWELLLAIALIVFMVAGTVAEIPPWNWVLTGSQHVRAYRREAAEESGRAPTTQPGRGGWDGHSDH